MPRLAAVIAAAVLAGAPTALADGKGAVKVKVTYAGQPSDAFDLICLARPGSDNAPTCHVANQEHVSTVHAAPGRYFVIEQRDSGRDRCYARHGHCTVVHVRAGRQKSIHWNLDRQTSTVS